jgi:hypothetical protein
MLPLAVKISIKDNTKEKVQNATQQLLDSTQIAKLFVNTVRKKATQLRSATKSKVTPAATKCDHLLI